MCECYEHQNRENVSSHKPTETVVACLWTRVNQRLLEFCNLLPILYSKSKGTRQISDQNLTAHAQFYSKLTDNLKPSPLYENNNLSYETMNVIYMKSTSIPGFSKNVMIHLFDKTELLECVNVRGLDNHQRVVGGRLDEDRIEIIRLIVEENAGDHFDQTLWQTCLNRMNIEIYRIKKPKRVNNQTKH